MSSLSCRYLKACATLLFIALAIPGLARGDFSFLAGTFDGGEPLADPGAYLCNNTGVGQPFQTVELSASASGQYRFFSAFSSWNWWDGDLPGPGLDLEMYLFDGTFDPATDWNSSLIWLGDTWDITVVHMEANQPYTLVLTVPCFLSSSNVGSWTIVASGEGELQSVARVEIPQVSTGEFDPAAPRAKGRCGEALQNLEVTYKQVGPVRVSRSGTYYFSDARVSPTIPSCQAVYRAAFDPANVRANLVANGYGHYYGRTEHQDVWDTYLLADTDYWFVVQPKADIAPAGKYLFAIARPEPFRINPGLTGLWADRATPGQGMYLDVFNSIDSVFMAWFTYDLQRPSQQIHAVLGDPGHRWLTGLGAIDGGSAEIQAVWTSGGLFDSSSPALTRTTSGQVRLEFDSCTAGRAYYEFASPQLSGVINLQRPFEDVLGVEQCRQFLQGPGKPGPL